MPPPSRRPVVIEIIARSGSKRLKDKNIRPLNGLPLMAYSILVAKSIPGVDMVMVNTDSPDYAAIAKEFGAEVPFLRPAHLAEDATPMSALLSYTQQFLMDQFGYWPRSVNPFVKLIQLLPTTPFRNVEKMTEYIERMHFSPLVKTYVRTDTTPDKLFFQEETAVPMTDVFNKRMLHQSFFKPLSNFMGYTYPYPSFQQCYIQLDNIYEMIDIDSDNDFRVAEMVVQNDLYDFGVSI